MISILTSPTTVKTLSIGDAESAKEENFLQLDGKIVFGPFKGRRKFKILIEENQIVGFEDAGSTCLGCNVTYGPNTEEVNGRKLCLPCAVKELKKMIP